MLVMAMDFEKPIEMIQVASKPLSDVGIPSQEFENVSLHEKKVESPSFLDQLMSFVSQMAKNFFFAIDQMSL